MATNIKCPHCSATIRVHARHIGKPGRCPKCRKVVMIRAPGGSDEELPSGSRVRRPFDSEDDFDVDEKLDRSYDSALSDSREFHVTNREAAAPRRRPRPAEPSSRNAGIILGLSIGGFVFLCVAVWGLSQFLGRSSDKGGKPEEIANSTPDNSNADDSKSRRDDSDSKPKEVAPRKENPPAERAVANNSQPAPAAPVSQPISNPTNNVPPPSNSIATAPSTPASPPTTPASLTPANPAPSGAPAAPPTSLEELLERAVNGVVMVNILDDSGQKIGHGSGFLLNREGLVATNFHVIEPASKATVKFHDGTECAVQGVCAWDDKRDIALIRIENPPASANTLELGPAEPPRQGAEIIAIGHPRGLQFTTTKGIVNAVHRNDQLPDEMRSFLKAPSDQVWIQMSAQIDRGSSGGPLLNASGQVVGVNTWVVTDVSFGFASHVQHLIGLMSQVKTNSAPKALADVGKRKKHAWGGGLTKLDGELAEIINEYKRKHEEFLVELEQAPTPKARESLVKSKNPAVSYSTKLLSFAKSAGSKQAAFQALYFSLLVAGNVTPETRAQKTVKEATDLVLSKHLDEPTLQLLVLAVTEIRLPEVRTFLQQVSEKSPLKEVQGAACFGLVRYIMSTPNLSDSAEQQLITLLERIQSDFADVTINDVTLGQIVEPLLYERKYLGIGKEAPEIVGNDSSGNELKLSDYRGKVVLLDFYANWCPYCVKMYPHERLLTEMLGSSFAVVGVNCDPVDELRAAESRKEITWKSFADGPGGPIATRWSINSYPTLFLIDQQGVIRQKFSGYVDPETLDGAIRKLLNNKSGGGSNRGSSASASKEGKGLKGLKGKRNR